MGEERQMKITVYHGATEIIEAPLNHVGRPRLDFGQGFYVTDLKDQAIKWAKTIAEKEQHNPYSISTLWIGMLFSQKLAARYLPHTIKTG